MSTLRGRSTVLALFPFKTPAPISERSLQSWLPDNHPFSKFVNLLERMDGTLLGRELTGSPYKLSEMLVDDLENGFVEQALRPGVQATLSTLPRSLSGSLPRPAMGTLLRYLTAKRLFDLLVYSNFRHTQTQIPPILLHAKNTHSSWDSTIWNEMDDLASLFENFTSFAGYLGGEGVQAGPSSKSQKPIKPTDHKAMYALVERLAKDTIQAAQSSAAFRVCANLNAVALNLAVIRLGFLELPESYEDLDLPATADTTRNDLKSMLKDQKRVKKLRQPLQIALMISPLTLLVPKLLQNHSFCPEQLLLTCKTLGNTKSECLNELEAVLWDALLNMAYGLCDARGAISHLKATWKDCDWPARLGDTRFHFRKDPIAAPLDLKLYEATILEPVPVSWTLTAISSNYISVVKPPGSPTGAPGPAASTSGTSASAGSLRSLAGLGPLPAPEGRGRGVVETSGSLHVPSNPLGQVTLSSTGTSEGQQKGQLASPTACSASVPDCLSLATTQGPSAPHTSPSTRTVASTSRLPTQFQDESDANTHQYPTRRSKSGSNAQVSPVQLARQTWSRSRDRPQSKKDSNSTKSLRKGSGIPGQSDEDSADEDPANPNFEVVDIDKIQGDIKDANVRKAIDRNMILRQEGLDIQRVLNPKLKRFVSSSNTLKYSDQFPSQMTFFDGDGAPYNWDVFAHTKATYDTLHSFYRAIRSDYSPHGFPRFLSQPSGSAFAILQESDFLSLSTQEVQKLVGDRCVILRGCKRPFIQFDRSGLERMGPMGYPIEIQDQSIDHDDGDYRDRVFSATLEDLYQASISPHEYAKSLNTLNEPNHNAGISTNHFASETKAFHQSTTEPYCRDPRLPAADLRWNIAATKGAHHSWHINLNGFATFIEVLCGLKLWIVARPKNHNDFSSLSFWDDGNLDMSGANLEKWSVEAIVLTSTTKLLMDPNRPHAAWTLEHSICAGGHFLPTSALEKTSFGLIHTFIRGKAITSTAHSEIWTLLHRQVIYYHQSFIKLQHTYRDDGHLPDLESMESFRGLMSLLVVIELHNILCSLSYQDASDVERALLGKDTAPRLLDFNALTDDHRQRRIFSRGIAIDLVHFLDTRYQFVHQETGVVIVKHLWNDIYLPMLAWTIHAIKEYYSLVCVRHASNNSFEHVADQETFLQQVQWSSQYRPDLLAAIVQLEGVEVTHLAWPGWNFQSQPDRSFTVVRKPQPCTHHVKDPSKLFSLGIRDGDRIYHRQSSHLRQPTASSIPAKRSSASLSDDSLDAQQEGSPRKRRK